MYFFKSNISGKISANPSKSFEQRALCCALLSRGKSILNNTGNNDDVIAAREIIKSLGAEITTNNNQLIINANKITHNNTLNCYESALCSRMFPAVFCLNEKEFTVTGEKTLTKRPIAKGFEIFKQMGCDYSSNSDKIPIKFTKSKLRAGNYHIKNSITSQIISGLMIAMPLLKESSRLKIQNPVSSDYIKLTSDCMRLFSVETYCNEYIDNNIKYLDIEIPGDQAYRPANVNIEGDWSCVANYIVAAAVNGHVEIDNLNFSSKQADRKIMELLEQNNINHSFNNNILKVSKSDLKAFKFNAQDSPDLIPILIVLALFCKGKSEISGAKRLIYKESSRAEVMKQELSKMNINIDITEDLITVYGHQVPRISSPVLSSHGDHRIAMALSIYLIVSDIKTGVKIDQHEVVSKSNSEFYNDLKKIGAIMQEKVYLKSASGFRNEELNSMTDVGSTDMSTENVAISYDEERSIEHSHRWHDIQLCSRKLLADLRCSYKNIQKTNE